MTSIRLDLPLSTARLSQREISHAAVPLYLTERQSAESSSLIASTSGHVEKNTTKRLELLPVTVIIDIYLYSSAGYTLRYAKDVDWEDKKDYDNREVAADFIRKR